MISDYIRDSFKNIKRNKKNVLLIVIFILLFVLLLVDVIFIKNFNRFLDDSVNKNFGFRTITVFKDNISFKEGAKELENVNHVVEILIPSYNRYYIETDIKFNGLDGNLTLLYGTPNMTPTSIVGKNITELSSGEMICPYDFYPDSSVTEMKIDGNKIISPEQSLNLEFNTFYIKVKFVDDEPSVDNEMKKFKIVGLYDSKLVMNNNNDCYITPIDMKMFNDALNPHINYESDDKIHAQVVIDRYSNLDEVIKKVQELGYDVSSTAMGLDMDMVDKISFLAIVFFIIIVCTIFFILINYLNKKLKNEIRYFGILRACGYTKKQVLWKQIIEISLMIIVGLSLGVILFSILFELLFNKLFNSLTYIGFVIKNDIIVLLLLSIGMFVLILVISFILIKKKVTSQIIDMLGDL